MTLVPQPAQKLSALSLALFLSVLGPDLSALFSMHRRLWLVGGVTTKSFGNPW